MLSASSKHSLSSGGNTFDERTVKYVLMVKDIIYLITSEQIADMAGWRYRPRTCAATVPSYPLGLRHIAETSRRTLKFQVII